MEVSPGAWQEAREVLKGAYDLHVHSGPSIFPRRADDWQVLAEAEAAGMAGVGLKAHEGDTAGRARVLGQKATGCEVYGGVALNHFVGGINPAAVEASLKLGGRIVWLPTLSARQHVRYYRGLERAFLGGEFKHTAGEGFEVVDENGRPTPAMEDVFELVSAGGAVLSTGHLSPGEALAVARAYRQVKRDGNIVMGHADLIINQASLAEQQEFVRLGGYVEKCVLALNKAWGGVALEDYAAGIRKVGVERCLLTSDAGGPDRPSSPETLARFLAAVLARKLLTADELRVMLVAVPRRLLGR